MFQKFFCLVLMLSAGALAQEPLHASRPQRTAGLTTEPPRASWGRPDAPITIVEYGSFQCPDTRDGMRVAQDLIARYPNRVRVIFKHRPIQKLPLSEPAAARFEALSLQDAEAAKRFSDFVFAHQDRLKTQGVAFLDQAVDEAVRTSARFDRAKFSADLVSPAVRDRIAADDREYAGFHFESGIPGFTVNGVPMLKEPYDRAAFEQAMARARR